MVLGPSKYNWVMGQERFYGSELDGNALATYAKTFISRRDIYPLQLENGGYVSIRQDLTDSMIAAHFKGYVTVGAYALDKSGWAKWIRFDADDDRRWQGLVAVGRHLETASIVPYLEPSRRGGHLWLFTPSIPGFQMRRFGKQLLDEHDIQDIEIYPKPDRPTTGPGSFVRLPLGIHRITGRRYHFITLDGQPLAPSIREQMQLLAHPQLVSQAFIDQVLERAPQARNVSPTPRFNLKPDSGGPVSERIKNRISVIDFVSQYVELDPQGKGHCPFHEDAHKSFQVSQNGNFWNCYAGCGGGSVIDFWMKWREKKGEDASFAATIRDLAKMLL